MKACIKSSNDIKIIWEREGKFRSGQGLEGEGAEEGAGDGEQWNDGSDETREQEGRKMEVVDVA